MNRGLFYSIEGIDFTGKSTQAKILTDRLIASGRKVHLTHEPGGTPFGLRIREIIKSEPNISLNSQFHLIEAQRIHHVKNVILPMLSEGIDIVCDRFIHTSYVYQHNYFTHTEWISYLKNYEVVPDLTFVLFSNNINSLKERSTRDIKEMDHFDNESLERLKEKQDLFLRVTHFVPRLLNINVDRDVDTISQDIWGSLKSKGIVE